MIIFKDAGKCISFNDEQLTNAPPPIKVIEEEIFIYSSEQHPLKVKFPIDVTEGGIIICFNDEHSLNAQSPIDVIVKEIVISFNKEHSLKVFASIELKEEGNITIYLTDGDIETCVNEKQ